VTSYKNVQRLLVSEKYDLAVSLSVNLQAEYELSYVCVTYQVNLFVYFTVAVCAINN